jgi:hypothetical protein
MGEEEENESLTNKAVLDRVELQALILAVLK